MSAPVVEWAKTTERAWAESIGWEEDFKREEWETIIRSAALASESDPLRDGFKLPIWYRAEAELKALRDKFPKGVITLFVSGGNRAAKSKWAGRHVMEQMVKKPGSRWWCADATERSSRDNQQRFIENFLPAEWKPGASGVLDKRRAKVTKVRYTIAGGFTENMLVLPNGSELQFKFYEQKLGTLQAVEIDGFWADELLPYDWIEEVQYRLVNRDGQFILTFTPVTGYTQTVGHFLEGGKVLEWVDTDPDIVKEKVPRLVQCADERARVLYFHTSDNPIFGNYEGMKAQVKDKSREEILMRVYGVVEKAAHTQFPRFREHVHVITLPRYKEMLMQTKGVGSRWHMVDPCSGRNWFMCWVYCPSPQKWIVYREWPSHGHPGAYIPGVGDPGPWATYGEPLDGERGPAQQIFGFGLTRYKEEIERVEQGEMIDGRWMDSRYGNSAKTEREGTTTLIEQMAELGMDFYAMTAEKSILNTNDGSIDLINSALYYDDKTKLGEFSAELGRLNEPQLLVVETCPNTIWALKNWTGKDGTVGACKDPVDVLRGLFLSSLDFIDPACYQFRGGGSY